MMYCLTGLALLSAEPSASQRWNIESGEVDSTDSRISEILIGSGSLLLREFVTLGYLLVTSQSKPFKCQVIAVRDLLSDNDTVSLGMAFTGEEEYGNVYVTLDIDEVNALIASMAMLEQIGVAVSVPVAIGGSLADSAGFYRCVDGVPLLTRRTCLCLDWP